jgi:outer membrane protein, heavy metal efflux system
MRRSQSALLLCAVGSFRHRGVIPREVRRRRERALKRLGGVGMLMGVLMSIFIPPTWGRQADHPIAIAEGAPIPSSGSRGEAVERAQEGIFLRSSTDRQAQGTAQRAGVDDPASVVPDLSIALGPPQEVSASGSSSVVTLDELVAEALKRNPEILAARRQYDVKRARVPQAKALPEPLLSVASMGNLLPFSVQVGDPSSARSVSFSQDIPFPGKLSLHGRAAAMEAEAERWTYELTWRTVVADVKMAYYDLYFVEKSVEIITRIKGLLEQFLQIAEARYRVGKAAQQDVLKAQTEISILLERLALLEQQRARAVARINALLDRPPETPLGRVAEVKKGELPYSLDELYQMAAARYPGLKREERRIDRAHYAFALARKEFYPDFAVGIQYVQRPRMPEMWGISFSVKLPLYFWKRQRPALEEAVAEWAQARHEYSGVRAQLFFRIKDAYLMAMTADRLLRLYEEGIIPQATLTLESAVAAYQVGTVDFLTLITNLITVLTYELNYYEQLVTFQKSLAQLEPLIAQELTR